MSLIRLVMGCAPCSVRADATWGASGVDMAMVATLLFADGRRAQLSCAMDGALHRRALIVGSQGVLETEYLNHTSTQAQGHPFGYQPSQMRVRRGVANVPFEAISSPTGSGFRFAAEAFAKVVARRDQAAIGRAASASLDIATTLEAIALSARRGQPVDLATLTP
jgi:predicted dehydrogenase